MQVQVDKQAELDKRKKRYKIAEGWLYLSIVASYIIIFASFFFFISGVIEYFGVDTNQNIGLIKLAIGFAFLIGEIIFQLVIGKLMLKSLRSFSKYLAADLILSKFEDEETIKEELEKLDKILP